MDSNKTFFDSIPSKSSFLLGFVTAVLCLGTLGFVVLGGCMLNGGCSGIGVAVAANDAEKTVAKTTAPTAVAPTNIVPAGKVPVVDETDHVRGAADAELTIIEYSDFECPFCSRFHPTMQQVMTEYDGKVRWVYRHFPLSFHPDAQPSAEAAECASEQGKFWEYADALFENQATLGDDLYQKLAQDLGLNVGAFNDCLESDRMLQVIEQDATAGAAAGVTGTPGSFLIDADGNAQAIKGALPYASIKTMIDAALGS